MKIVVLAASFSILFALAASANEADEWARAGEPGDTAKITRTVAVEAGEMGGAMYFNPDQLNVAAGETIKFVVTNKGQKDHEFVIGDIAFHAKHIEEMQANPSMEMDSPNALSLKPGETKSIVWHFTKPGDFMYACDIPGHLDNGMEGEVHVK